MSDQHEDERRRGMRHLEVAAEQLRIDVDMLRSRLERIETSIDTRLSSINQSVIDIRAELAERRLTADQMNELRVVGDYIKRVMPRMMILSVLMVTILAAFGGAIVWQVASLNAQTATAAQLSILAGKFDQRAMEVDRALAGINERISRIGN